MNLHQAKSTLTHQFFTHIDGFCLPESCGPVNASSRAVIRAYKRHYGSCWVGKINLYDNDRGNPDAVMREYKSGVVYNFQCDFVIPAYDQILVDLIIDRDTSEYTGAKDDFERIDKIMDRITDIGGTHLIWS